MPTFKQRILAAVRASAGGGGLAAALRQVATRSYVPSVASGTNAYAMSVTAHVATEALTSIQTKFPAWYVSGTGEVQAVGTMQYTASVEYPAGTFTQIKWSGATSKTVAIGVNDTGLCDAVPVSIPKGAVFWIRNFCVANGGTPITGGLPVTQAVQSTRWSAQNEASILSATSISDQTMSGTVTDGGTGALIYPLCIVQNTTNPAVGAMGDSRTIGTGMTPDANGCQGQVTPSLGSAIAWIDTGVGGTLMQYLNSAGQRAAALVRTYCSHVIGGYGGNDLKSTAGNRTAAQVQGDAFIFGKLFPGKAIALCTISPVSTSTDSFTTVVNQTADSNSAAMATYNAYVLTTPSPFAASIDVAGQTADSGTPSKWKVDAGPTAITADGLHCNSTGYTDIKNSGIFTVAAISALNPVSQFSVLDTTLAPLALWSIYSNPAITPTTGTGIGNAGQPNTWIGSSAPTYGAASFNGGPGYSFNGSGQGFLGDAAMKTAMSGATGYTLAILFQLTSLPAANRTLFGVTINGANTERAFLYVSSTGNLNATYRRLDADGATNTSASASNPVGAGGYGLGMAVFDPVNNTVTVSCNGVVVATGTWPSTGNFSATAANNVTIGILSGAGPVMVVRETLLLTGAVSSAVRQKIEGDIAWRNGLQATVLPAGHPYFSAAPTS